MIAFALMELAFAGCREVAVVVAPEKRELRDLLENLPPFPVAASRRFFPREEREVSGWPRLRLFEQRVPRGVVDALAQARPYLEGEPFGLVMPDNLLPGDRAAMAVLGREHARLRAPVIGVIEIDAESATRAGNCGRVRFEDEGASGGWVRELADKRAGLLDLPPGTARILRGVGRSIVPASFADLDETERLGGAEVDDVPRFQELVAERRLWGVRLDCLLYDLGQVPGLTAARIAFEEGETER
jgi:UTP-glucose-1-phosphate uridylyltransferase